MSIFATDELLNLFISKGMNPDTAVIMQTALLSYETAGFITAKDPTLVSNTASLIRYGVDLFGMGTDTEVARSYLANNLTFVVRCLHHFVTTPDMNEYMGRIEPTDFNNP